jgi:hypothetical protein
MKEILNKKIFKVLLQIAIYASVGLFIYLSLKGKISQVESFEIRNYWMIAGALGIQALTVFIFSHIWHLMMNFSGEKIPVVDSYDVYLSSYITRYIPGSVWAVFARAGFNKKYNVPSLKSAWGWFIENLGFLIIGGLFSLFALFKFGEFESYAYVAIPVLIAFGLLVFMNYEKFGVVFDKLVKKKLSKGVQKEVEILELSRIQKVKIFMLYVLTWVLYSIQYFMVSVAVADLSLSDFLVLTGINAISYTLGYLSIITPTGTGVREGVMIAALQGLNLVNGVQSVVLTVLARIVYVVGEVLFFAGFKLYYLIRSRNEK